MSTQRPDGSRRRRIAGERRPARPLEEGTPAEPPVGDPGPSEADTGRMDADVPAVPPVAAHRQESPPPQPEATRRSDSDEARGPDRPTRGWWGSPASVFTLVGLLVVVLTLGGVMAVAGVITSSVGDRREAEAAARAAETAPATAERAAEAILAYDHQTLDADQDAATRFMTDDFAEQYSETFEKVVKPTAEEGRATVVAAVKGSATVRASSDRVRVLLFVDQTTVSRANEDPQVALNRVQMIMVRDGDSWLVDDITSY